MLTQEQKILAHLERGLSITGLQASDLYRVRDLPKRISVLRGRFGVPITREMRTDVEGGRYMHYVLTHPATALAA